MLDHEDLKWIATTSTELNSMLQQISRYADLARQHKGEYNYIEMLGERVELHSLRGVRRDGSRFPAEATVSRVDMRGRWNADPRMSGGGISTKLISSGFTP